MTSAKYISSILFDDNLDKNSYLNNLPIIKHLAKEKVIVLTADGIYPELAYTKEAHVRAMRLLGEIDAWRHILPAVDAIKNSFS